MMFLFKAIRKRGDSLLGIPDSLVRFSNFLTGRFRIPSRFSNFPFEHLILPVRCSDFLCQKSSAHWVPSATAWEPPTRLFPGLDWVDPRALVPARADQSPALHRIARHAHAFEVVKPSFCQAIRYVMAAESVPKTKSQRHVEGITCWSCGMPLISTGEASILFPV